jgi:biotin transporter BioY
VPLPLRTIEPSNRTFWQMPLLIVGDLLMLLLFVVIGRISHGMTSDWLINIARIATPFVLGWVIAALIVGAYRPNLWRRPSDYLTRSAAAWLMGVGIAFLLRHFLMQDRITVPFALTSIAFTGLFLLGWRLIFLLGDSFSQRHAADQSIVQS